MGGVLAPLINLLGRHTPVVPMVIFGSTPLLAAVFALALPETANQPLPDSIYDTENEKYTVTPPHTLGQFTPKLKPFNLANTSLK